MKKILVSIAFVAMACGSKQSAPPKEMAQPASATGAGSADRVNQHRPVDPTSRPAASSCEPNTCPSGNCCEENGSVWCCAEDQYCTTTGCEY